MIQDRLGAPFVGRDYRASVVEAAAGALWVRVRRGGLVAECSPSAARALAEPDAPLHIAAGRLTAQTLDDMRRVAAMVEAGEPKRNGPSVTVVGEGDVTWPLTSAVVDDGVELSIRPVGPSLGPYIPALDRLFGLTPTENDILLRLLDGAAVQAISADTGKAVATVRTHVKRIYAKVGVNTKEQLFSRILRISLAL